VTVTPVPFRSGIGKAANPGNRILGTRRLTSTERQLTSTFGESFRGLTADLDTAVLARALSSRNVGAAVQAFNWSTFGERMSTSRLPLLQQVRDTGAAEARSLGKFIGTYAFDVTDPRATTWAAARSSELVVGIGDQLRSEIRNLITSSFVNQIAPREIAQENPRQIGLFPRWAAALQDSYQRSYTSFLAEGLTSTEAASRAERLAEAYRDRLIDARSMMIARTEVMTAANQGRAISWQQAQDAGLVDLANSSKEWIAEADACEECSIYDGEIVGASDDFSSDDGMPPAHPNCRCTAALIPGELPGDAQSSKPEGEPVVAE